MRHDVRVAGLLVALLAGRPAVATETAGQGGGWPPPPAVYAPTGTEVAPGLAVGDVLERSNAKRAAGLLPPEVLRHYENGDYRNAIASWPDAIMRRSATFDAASAANDGRYALDPDTGTIVEAATGAPAGDIYGLPFAAAKAANLERGGDRGNQHTGGKGPTGLLPSGTPPITTSRAAAVFGVSVSERQVKRSRGQLASCRTATPVSTVEADGSGGVMRRRG